MGGGSLEDWPKHLDELNASDCLYVAAHYRRDRKQGMGRPVSSGAGVAIVGLRLDRPEAREGARRRASRHLRDIAQDRADRLAATVASCKAVTDWKLAVSDPAVSIVIISTLHDHACGDRPRRRGGRQACPDRKAGGAPPSRACGLAEAAAASGRLVRIGFNHRYHPRPAEAHDLVTSGALGPLMFLRARYGHGGRVGYDRELAVRSGQSGWRRVESTRGRT